MKSAYLITENAITVFFDEGASPKTITSSSTQFHTIKDAIKAQAGDDEIRQLFDEAEAIKRFTQGAITVEGDQVIYAGQPVNHVVADRIRSFMRQGLPWQPLANFLVRLFHNPSRRSVETLYPFLEHAHLAITDSGMIRGYKAIRNNWRDKHSGTVFNGIGTLVPRMDRNKVDDDPDVACSYGYHFGNLGYVRGFACGYGDEGGDRIVIVEVDPADIVAVPYDCDHGKVRCVQYRVVAEFTGPLPEYIGTATSRDIEDDDPDFTVEDDERETREEFERKLEALNVEVERLRETADSLADRISDLG